TTLRRTLSSISAHRAASAATLHRFVSGHYFRFPEPNPKQKIKDLLTIVIVPHLLCCSILYCYLNSQKMRTVIVFNHPYEGSYCNAILVSVSKGLQKAGHVLDVMHLDKDQLQPRMTSDDLKAFVEHRPVDPQVINYHDR